MTSEQLMECIKSMPEIEVAEFTDALIEHLDKNKMIHLINFNNEEIEDLQSEIEHLKDTINEIRGLCYLR